MIREIKENLYKVTRYGTTNIFIESETKKELFQYLIEQENKGVIITNVNIIYGNGTKQRIAFKTDSEYKELRKTIK